jgi:uncharacterized protein YprB with RNaseH-like and TPR domain
MAMTTHGCEPPPPNKPSRSFRCMRNIVYFDLETQRSFTDVGGAANRSKMGVSLGVTYSTLTGEYRIFPEDRLEDLVTQLLKADLVVGYNHLHFDYPVLQPYTIFDLASQTVNLDMLVELEALLGFRLKLDSLASATLGAGKSADGLDALKWWQQYKKSGDPEPLLKIASYCAFDVKVTKCIHEYAVQHGHLRYDDRNGNVLEVPVSWV